jgi:3-oxoacyl-[acyl-carrier-protein] synthase-3
MPPGGRIQPDTMPQPLLTSLMRNPTGSQRASIGIAGLGYCLPTLAKPLEELEQEGRLNSSATLLRSYGFEQCLMQEDPQAAFELVLQSAQQAVSVSQRGADEISRVFLYSGILAPAAVAAQENGSLHLFKYPAAELQHRLKLPKANAIGLSQQGCSGLLSAIDMAGKLLAGPGVEAGESILCAALDCLPPWAEREILYNIISDAAGALIISRNCPHNRIVHFHQHVQSYYWNTPLHELELMASYFPIAQRVIAAALEGAGLKLSDLRWIVPHNVSLRSWEILAKLLEFPMDKIWTRNIPRVGHTVSCDHIINLVDMEREGALQDGDYLLLFTFGFGARWSAMVIQH